MVVKNSARQVFLHHKSLTVLTRSQRLHPMSLREAEARCKLLGLTGRDLAICAAPRNGEWTIDTGL